MRELLILAIHLLVTVVRLLRPGGVRAVVAESLLLKHQILISNRSRRHSPNLTTFDHWVFGLTTRRDQVGSVRSDLASLRRTIDRTIQREYLDRAFFWNAVDLARKLCEFSDYYKAYRVHRSLDGTTPAQRTGAS